MSKTPAPSHPIEVRKANLVLLVGAALKRTEPFTRADLAADTGLSIPTVSGLVSELVSRGLLKDLGARRAKIGRSPSQLEFNASYGFLVGIAIGPSHTRLVIADLRQTRLAQAVIATPTREVPARGLAVLAQKAYELLADHLLPADRVIAVGAGVPGVIDETTGIVVSAPYLPGWHDVGVRDILESAFPSPVVVANDVHLALIAEHARGAARGHERCVFISVGASIAASVLVNGHVERGQHFMAGQIGRMCFGAEHVGHAIGDPGCLDTLASLGSLEQRIPRAPEEDRLAWLTRIVEAAEGGQADARAAVLETTRLVGLAAANVAAVVDPSIIVFGGALFAGAPRLVAAVGAVVQSIWHAPVTIALSELNEEAPVWGSVLAANKAARLRLRRELWPNWAPSTVNVVPDSP